MRIKYVSTGDKDV